MNTFEYDVGETVRIKKYLSKRVNLGEYKAIPIEIALVQAGRRFEINSLLPEQWKIAETNDVYGDDNQAVCVYSDKVIYLPKDLSELYDDPDYLSSDEAILTVLHEIGHSWQEKFPEECAVLLWHLSTGRRFESLSADQQNILRKYDYQSERDAWAYALKKLRHMRNIGIDPEPYLENNELSENIADSLRNHRRGIYKELVK